MNWLTSPCWWFNDNRQRLKKDRQTDKETDWHTETDRQRHKNRQRKVDSSCQAKAETQIEGSTNNDRYNQIDAETHI